MTTKLLDPNTAALVEDIGKARGTDYFLMKEQLTDAEVQIYSKVRSCTSRHRSNIYQSIQDRRSQWCSYGDILVRCAVELSDRRGAR